MFTIPHSSGPGRFGMSTLYSSVLIKDKVCPNHTGVDLNCGVLGCFIPRDMLNLEDIPRLDKWLRSGGIPSGKNVRSTIHEKALAFRPESLIIKDILTKRDLLSLGTLGGGNHFLELGETKDGYWLFIHSGSRNLGLRVATYHQEIAVEQREHLRNKMREDLINNTLPENRSKAIKDFHLNNFNQVYGENAFLTGIEKDNYLRDVTVMAGFASLNRNIIATEILKFLNIDIEKTKCVDCTHNFIENNILRKGAIPAYKGDIVFIPLNMKDGVIIGFGKGNPDWNYSAPHGAGRILSRSQAKKILSMDKFKEDMKDIITSSVNEKTLDECPDAYKPKDEILSVILETVDIVDISKPIYNFKAND